MFFFERILERISKSKYNNNIILKGGLLLASIIGEDGRTTKDMDATLKSLPLDTEKITNIFNEILSVALEDEGIIYRKDYHVNPSKVEYGMTELGLELSKMLDIMASFGDFYKSKTQ